MSETPITIADLNKTQAEANATLAKAQADFKAFESLSTLDLLAKLSEVTSAQGAITRAEANVAKSKEAIAEFEANAAFEKLNPMREAAKAWMQANASKLPTNVATGVHIEIKMADDGTFEIVPLITYAAPDLEGLKASLAETLAAHRQLMKSSHVDALFVGASDIGKANMMVSVGRTSPKAAKAPKATGTAKVSEGDFKVGDKLTRVYKGTTYTCDVTPDGFLFNGETFKSASGAATAVSGNSENGNRFWKVA